MVSEPVSAKESDPIQDLMRRCDELDFSQLPWYQAPVKRRFKRLVDVVASAGLLSVALPVMGATAIVVRLSSPGPILFKQVRLGLGGAPYPMYKFRTMRVLAEDGSAGVTAEVTKSDSRLTPVGHFLRASRLDELPQLFQVLAGDMSLVGPRPDVPANIPEYTPEQLWRFAMPPGCTAWTFTRGAFENEWASRQNINVEYVNAWTFWLDIEILWGSFIVLLTQKGANPTSDRKSDFSRHQKP